MHILSVDNLQKAYEGRTLFSGVCFGVGSEDRIGIVGPNGSGKSTLLRILSGAELPDEGRVTVNTRARLASLAQDTVMPADCTLLDFLFTGDAAAVAALREHQRAAEEVACRPDDSRAQRSLADAAARLDVHGAWETEAQGRALLHHLGLFDPFVKIGSLSGGQRRRAALAKALMGDADLLFLDEPTNHLDVETVDWLERRLKQHTGGLVLVTHDRYFLERCVNHIFEIADKKVHRHEGTYQTVVEARLDRAAQSGRGAAKRRNILRKELEWLRRGPKARGSKAKFRVRQAETLRDVKEEKTENLRIGMGRRRLGNVGVELEGVCKNYGDHTVLREVSLRLGAGDRAGIVGPNGAGKTTLLRIIAGQIQCDGGSARLGSTAELGFYEQETTTPPSGKRVLQVIRDVADHVTTAQGQHITASQLAEQFLFDKQMQGRAVNLLSGGERRRLALCGLLMRAPNILLFDEPTNDLDLETLSVLEDWLDGFTGALLVASHDRYLLDRLVDTVYAIEPEGVVRKHPGDWSAYRASKTNRTETGARSPRPEKASSSQLGRTSSVFRLSYKDRRELVTLEKRISFLEAQKNSLLEALAGAAEEHAVLSQLGTELDLLSQELTEVEERWLDLSLAVESAGAEAAESGRQESKQTSQKQGRQ